MHPFLLTEHASDFQAQISDQLSHTLDQRKSVVLIGMKRVGINTFLRQYLSEKKLTSKRISLLVDLNNLAERSLYAFWILTLKTILDEIQTSEYPADIRSETSELFTQSIQLHDSFFTLHAVQRLLKHLSQLGCSIDLFLLRFDRLHTAITNEFYSNLQGLKDDTPNLAYVLTSYRPLYELLPEVFPRNSVLGFFQEQYVLPLSEPDQKTLLKHLCKSYEVTWTPPLEAMLIGLCGGHVQYLHLAILVLKHRPELLQNLTEIPTALLSDESTQFLSEEILSSLTEAELFVLKEGSCTTLPNYLTQAGILNAENKIFSPLLQSAFELAHKKGSTSPEFTKKEHLFFEVLRNNLGEVVSRDQIIRHVWPEENEFGVSDWAVDRLAARVRRKLTKQSTTYTLQTVITRGYKLVSGA